MSTDESKGAAKSIKLILFVIVAVIVAVAIYLFLARNKLDVLSARGPIAKKERNLLIFALLLSVLIVIPVYFLTFYIALKYREENEAEYKPSFNHSRIYEAVWWVVPSLLITILSVVAWRSSHALDPFKPLNASIQPMTIQVVALDWKWLFIYPDQNIATVNYVQFPANTPIEFKITADAPMNSFWIPKLGGQIYAMSGMSTEVNLQADELGSFRGSSANISGKGFAGMHFMAQSTTNQDFENWAEQTRNSNNILNEAGYAQMAKPSENIRPESYRLEAPNLYNNVIAKYMGYDHAHNGGVESL